MAEHIRYGIATPQDLAGRTGREVLQGILDGSVPAPPIAQLLRFRLVEVGDGSAVFEGDPDPSLCNLMGVLHGGWALTLLDSVTGCAAHSTLPAGTGYTTLETKGNFHPRHHAHDRPRPGRGQGGGAWQEGHHGGRLAAHGGWPAAGARHLDAAGAAGSAPIRPDVAVPLARPGRCAPPPGTGNGSR